MDGHLQPLVATLPSHLRDTNHFLERLASIPSPLPTGALLVTLDVTSLYTNIPHTAGLSALEYFLDSRPQPAIPTTAFLRDLAHNILTNNHFQFLGTFYHQRTGTAMGTRMAPSYANLFMGRLEANFLRDETLQPLCWLRFIDDIFMIWCHGEEALNSFLTRLNSNTPVQFTWTISPSRATFLDVDIELTNSTLQTAVHIKPTNLQQYLHYNSCHPPHVKKALPYCLATRARRIYSSYEALATYNNNLVTTFIKRGYPPQLVKDQIHQATHYPHPPNTRLTRSTPFVTTYFPGVHRINRLLKEGHTFLAASPSTLELYPSPPKLMFRRPPNLQDLLVKRQPVATPPPMPLRGAHSCHSRRCLTCPILSRDTNFHSPVTNISYPIKGSYTCTSTYSVYLLKCNFCPAFYVGMARTPLNYRMNNHRRDCNSPNPSLPVPLHAGTHNKSFQECFTVTVLSHPRKKTPKDLHNLELAFQLVLKSRFAPGLNIQ